MASSHDGNSILRWGNDTRTILEDCSSLFRLFNEDASHLSKSVELAIVELGLKCTLTSDSAILLITAEKLWDAEMLCRSVLEGTCRLAYIALADEEERERRADEFWNDLFNVSQLRHQRVISTFLKGDNQSNPQVSRVFEEILMGEDDVNALKDAYPRRLRRQLEQKWSLSTIVEWLSQLEPMTPASGVLWSYAMSSHVIHQDGTAIQIMKERAHRSHERIQAIELAHASREFSDLITYSLFRAWCAYRAKGIDIEPVQNAAKHYQTLLDEFSGAFKDWYAIEYNS